MELIGHLELMDTLHSVEEEPGEPLLLAKGVQQSDDDGGILQPPEDERELLGGGAKWFIMSMLLRNFLETERLLLSMEGASDVSHDCMPLEFALAIPHTS